MEKMVKLIFRWVGILTLVCFLMGCQDKKKETTAQKKETIITAKIKTPTVPLYYSGVLQPLQMLPVVSPVAGNVIKRKFRYGTFVKKGQVLVVISSSELTQNFRKTITDYLTKKSTFETSLENFQGLEALFKAGVISKEAYLSGKNQYQTSQLSFFQAQFAMEKVLKRAGVDISNIERLTLGDKKEIIAILKRQFRHIDVKSPASGIALFPSKSSGSSDTAKKLHVGGVVKEGQLLLTIGDLSGLSAEIQIAEVNVNHIKKNMKAIVTSSAFPGITLKGYIASVSSQANPSSDSSGSAMFVAKIDIPNLQAKYKKIIRVGMTAKVQINVKKAPVVMVPIAAVFQKDGAAAVTVVDSSGKRRTVGVVTSFTTPTEAAIASGIKAGDRVVVPGNSDSSKAKE